MTLRDLPTRLGIGAIWLVHWLPFPLQALIGNGLGLLFAAIPGKRRRIAATNLALCFPEASRWQRTRWLVDTHCASVRAALEHGVLWWSSDARLRRIIRLDNANAALGDGQRPVIWLAPHFNGLDMGGVRMTQDWHFASLYANARNPEIDRLTRHARSRFHPTVLVPKREGIKPILRALKDGMPAYYLPDQDHGRLNAVFAPFFGIPAATLSALPRLAKLSGAQVVPAITRRLSWGRGYAVHFYPPWDDFPTADLDADVARMNRFIEDRVREMPADYLWLHRRFKTRPEGCANLYG